MILIKRCIQNIYGTIQYLFFGDTLLIDMAIGGTSDKGFDLMFRINGKHSGKIVTLAKIGVLFFDYESRQVALIPEGFLESDSEQNGL